MKNKEIAIAAFKAVCEAYKNGKISFEKARLFDDLFLHADEPTPNVHRFTYVMFDKNEDINAQSVFIFKKGNGTLDCGWTVSEEHRGKGLGNTIVERSIQELTNGLSKAGVKSIALAACVDEGNIPSIQIARKWIGDEEVMTNANGEKVHTYRKVFKF